MKHRLYLLLFWLIYLSGAAQQTTRILFIGNSFTYGNNMPQMVKAFADTAHIPVIVGMHAPGGISVGDTAQGTMAHMNNPALFALIRSQKWDYAVIQDNQGRFVRDSGVFSPASKVVQGHLNIMDSVKKNNDCAKIILFAGWAWKAGSPPFGNTGEETMRRILVNYGVLNDTMKEVIAPIAEAWIKSSNYMPLIDLWDLDGAHSSYSGAYLTASVIFSSIFNLQAKALNYSGTMLHATAYNLRCYADTAVFNPVFHKKYNLGGARPLALQNNGGQLLVPGTYVSYAWYKNGIYVGNSSSLPLQGSGEYKALVEEADGCVLKTCSRTEVVTTGIGNSDPEAIRIFPNPVTGGELTIRDTDQVLPDEVQLVNATGVRLALTPEKRGEDLVVPLQDLVPGCYVLLLRSKGQVYRKTLVIGN